MVSPLNHLFPTWYGKQKTPVALEFYYAFFGIGLAVILFLVILLGVKAFYPEPDYTKSCPVTRPYVMIPCDSSVSETECNLHQQIEQQKYQDSISVNEDCSNKFEDDLDIYKRTLLNKR